MNTNPANEQLDYQKNVISLAARVTPPNILVEEKLPGFVAAVQAFIQNFVDSKPEFHIFAKGSANALFKDTSHNYVSLSKVTVFVPTGMKCSYLEWLTVLETLSKQALTIEERVLKPFSDWLGAVLSDDERFFSRRPLEGLKTIEFTDIKKIQKDVEKCIKPRGKDQMPYADAVGRNKEWEEINGRLSVLNEETARVSPENIRKQTDQISEFLDKILANLQNEEFLQKLEEYGPKMFSRNLVSALSDYSYDVAKEIEFYSIYVYHLEVTTQAVQDTYDKLRDILKKK